jgi:hypothetical protein
VPGLRHREPELWLFTADSWARRTLDSNTVEQYGPRRLWDELEHVYAHWEALGKPDRAQLGLTVTADGSHILWLDTPIQPITTL